MTLFNIKLKLIQRLIFLSLAIENIFLICALGIYAFGIFLRKLIFSVYKKIELTLNVSKNGLSWSHDMSELVDEPYQATCACGPEDVPSSLQDTVMLRT